VSPEAGARLATAPNPLREGSQTLHAAEPCTFVVFGASGDLTHGTLYPALLKLEQEGFIKAEWRQSENNRRAKYYTLTAPGRKQLARETKEWNATADLIAAFLSPKREAK